MPLAPLSSADSSVHGDSAANGPGGGRPVRGGGPDDAGSESTGPKAELASDRISVGQRVERGVHLAGSVSMIAMTPLMLGMMFMPRGGKSTRGDGGGASTTA